MDVQFAVRVILLTAVTGFAFGAVTQGDLDYISTNLHIKVKVVDNLQFNGGKHQFLLTLKNTGSQTIRGDNWSIYFYSFFMLESDHLPRPGGYEVPGQGVKLDHVAGCLFKMSPTSSFKNVDAMGTNQIQFYGQNWAVSRSDIPPNWYITSNGLQSRLINSTAFGSRFVEEFTSPKQWKRYRNDQYNPYTPRGRFERYQMDTDVMGKLIIPTPKQMTVNGQGYVNIRTGSWKVRTGSPEAVMEGQFLSGLVNLTFDGTSTVKDADTIFLDLDPSLALGSEGYTLTVSRVDRTVTITANHTAGLFYGGQSLVSLLAGRNDSEIPEVTITDEPHFEFRGMYVDLARNFHDKTDLKRLMNAMVMYKLNKLHLHLADDEGWRLEIPGLPELTEVASKRCHDPDENLCLVPQLGSGPDNTTSGSGFLTKADYIEIVTYANRRHIEVIPEVDSPGHARAAIMAMEKRYRNFESSDPTAASEYRLEDPTDMSRYFSVQMFTDNAINPCIESTYTFIAKVMDEIMDMHQAAGQPLKVYHYGGDEVPNGAWVNSSECTNLLASLPPSNDKKYLKNYFLNKTANLAYTRGLALSGWEDGWIDGSGAPYPREMFQNSDVMANAWDNVWEWGASKRANNLANLGYKVVLSHATHLYFDHPYEPDPEERGLYWAPRFTDTMKTFGYVTSDTYKNVDFRRSGEVITKAEVCGADNSGCPTLNHPENVIGLQGHIWSETVLSPELFDYMIFPRLLAVAERGWHRASWEDIDNEADRKSSTMSDWKQFAKSLGEKELSRLDKLGIRYRIPPPGARVDDVTVHPTTQFPGLPVEYKRHGEAEWSQSPAGGVNFSGRDAIYLRTRSADGQRVSREVTVTSVPVLAAPDQTVIDYIATQVDIRVDVVDNLKETEAVTQRMTLTNKGEETVTASAWIIYFDSIRLMYPKQYPYPEGVVIPEVGFRLYHMGGTLYQLKPEPSFRPLEPQQKLSFVCEAQFWLVTRSDFMPNMFVGGTGMVSKVIESTQGEEQQFVGDFTTSKQWKRYSFDQYDPYLARTRYRINDDVTDTAPVSKRVIPTPYSTRLTETSRVTVTNDWVVVDSADFPDEAKSLAYLFSLSVVSASLRPASKYIEYRKEGVLSGSDEIVTSEAYKIEINAGNSVIAISANQTAGAFYAMKTLHKLSTPTDTGREFPNGSIIDGPRFGYRGMHLDVGRNFHSKADVLKLLDAMATYKMNRLHFHLSEDEGWRLEIPGLPELTEVGSRRCHDNNEETCILPQLGSGPDNTTSGSGYYSVADYRDILKSASRLHIMVIPEFDMPGHARAAIKSMEARERNSPTEVQFLLTEADDPSVYLGVQMFTDNAINPCLESTFRFTDHIITEVVKMHQDIQPLKMFHFGGDEVAKGAWVNSSACESFIASNNNINGVSDLKEYFAMTVAHQVAARGLDVGAWEDGLMKGGMNPYNRDTLPSNISVYGYAWDNIWEWGVADRAYKLANAGYKVVLAHATHLYFDHPYEPDPEERGYYWATRYTDTRKTFGYMPDNFFWNAEVKRSGQSLTHEEICGGPQCLVLTKPENIAGIQGNLWTETIRTDEQMDQMVFPRLLALAERAWHKASWEKIEDKTARTEAMNKDWNEFANYLGYNELSSLDSAGVHYRVPPPGGVSEEGKLKVNSAYPGLPIQVSTNNGNTWAKVKGSTQVPYGSSICLRTRSADSSRTSRVVRLTDLTTSGSASPLIHVAVLLLVPMLLILA